MSNLVEKEEEASLLMVFFMQRRKPIRIYGTYIGGSNHICEIKVICSYFDDSDLKTNLLSVG